MMLKSETRLSFMLVLILYNWLAVTWHTCKISLCRSPKIPIYWNTVYLPYLVSFLALQYNKRYTKAYLRRAKAYEKLDQKQNCLQGMSKQAYTCHICFAMHYMVQFIVMILLCYGTRCYAMLCVIYSISAVRLSQVLWNDVILFRAVPDPGDKVYLKHELMC
jgi:hypothetical protein